MDFKNRGEAEVFKHEDTEGAVSNLLRKWGRIFIVTVSCLSKELRNYALQRKEIQIVCNTRFYTSVR